MGKCGNNGNDDSERRLFISEWKYKKVMEV